VDVVDPAHALGLVGRVGQVEVHDDRLLARAHERIQGCATGSHT